MSLLDSTIDKIVAETGSSRATVKLIMASALEKLPRDRKATESDFQLALEATGVEIQLLIKRATDEFHSLGAMKKMLAIAAINSELPKVRSQLENV